MASSYRASKCTFAKEKASKCSVAKASKYLSAVLLLIVALPVQALTIFTCEPEWAALSRQLAPEAKIYSATHVYQDPHYIEARPSLIAKLAKADMAICSGASLEAGWLPALQKRASNRRVSDGSIGMLYLSEHVNTIEKHEKGFFSTEHVHPEGNPHFHLDPERVAQLARVISERMQQIDPEQKDQYVQSLQRWQSQWQSSIEGWQAIAEKLRSKPIVVQHSSFSYLLNWTGMKVVADLEPNPGVPPTMTHLQGVVATVKQQSPTAVVTNWYQNDKGARWLSEEAHLTHLSLPATVDLEGEINDLTKLFDHLLVQLQGAN
ncbi:MAG: ABC transporter substrate-binding protein [Oceanospirillaceae bacterium]|nr:ABC transporter substrate-binding protein [Oceanospirillaceae bacterium]|tara:strand:- start:6971 stop:7930 length:960 start_codon:yes stop_codon:yes gene_type:complete